MLMFLNIRVFFLQRFVCPEQWRVTLCHALKALQCRPAVKDSQWTLRGYGVMLERALNRVTDGHTPLLLGQTER